jgi:hypothetical protein
MEFSEFMHLPEIQSEYKIKYEEFLEYFRKNFKSKYMDQYETLSMIVKLAAVRTDQYFSGIFNKKLTIIP